MQIQEYFHHREQHQFLLRQAEMVLAICRAVRASAPEALLKHGWQKDFLSHHYQMVPDSYRILTHYVYFYDHSEEFIIPFTLLFENEADCVDIFAKNLEDKPFNSFNCEACDTRPPTSEVKHFNTPVVTKGTTKWVCPMCAYLFLSKDKEPIF